MNSDHFTASDVSPTTSLHISAIGDPEELADDDNDGKVAKCSVPICPPPDQEQVEDMDQESLVPHLVPDVSQPTQQEIEEHNKTHLNFRSWCPHCVAGKSVERNFAATSHEPSCLPCFQADYMFLGEKDTEGTTPILTLKDDKQYSVFADVVPQKGAHDFVTKQILEDIDTTGFTDIIFKTDNEPAIVAVRNEVKQNGSHKTVPENSIRGQSRSNGFIENANKFVAGQIRTLRSALHTNLNHVINRDHPVI